MTSRLTEKVDLGVYFMADTAQFAGSARPAITMDHFYRRYRACPSVGFEIDGTPVGGVIYDGETAHIAVLEAYHGRWATLFRPALAWLLAIRPEIEVKVARDNLKCVRFLERSGWPFVRGDDIDVTYLIRATTVGARRDQKSGADQLRSTAPA